MRASSLLTSFAIVFLLFISINSPAQSLARYMALCDSFYYKGNWNEALVYAEKALAVSEKEGGKVSRAYARVADQAMGMVHEKKGNYGQAEIWYRTAVDLFRQLKATTSVEYGEALVNLGNLHTTTCAYAEAERVLVEARTVLKNVPIMVSQGYDAAGNNLANVYNYTGRYAEAETLYLELAEKLKKLMGEANEISAAIYNNLAGLYSYTGRYTKALPAIKKALSFYQPAGAAYQPAYANALLNAAMIYGYLQLPDSAEARLTSALGVLHQHNNPALLAHALNIAGTWQQAKSNPAKAQVFFEQAMEQAGNSLPGTYLVAAANLAAVYVARGDGRRADSLFKASFQRMAGFEKPNYRSLNQLYQGYCSYLLSQKRFAEAADSLQSLGRQTLAYIRQNFVGMTEAEKLSFVNTLYHHFDLQYALLALDKKAAPAFVQHAYNNVQLLKGLVLYNQAALVRSVAASADTALKTGFVRWLALKQMIAKQASADGQLRSFNLDSLEEEANGAEKILGRFAQAGEAFLPYSADALKEEKTLAANEALLEFVRFRYATSLNKNSVVYGAFVWRGGEAAPQFTTLCSEVQLQQLLTGERTGSGLQSTQAMAKIYPLITAKQTIATTQSQRLYQLLWKPLLPLLGGATNICYSPAGLLHTVAFNAIGNSGNGVLLDHYNLTALFRTGDLQTAKKEVPLSTIGLWGNIDYGAGSASAQNRRNNAVRTSAAAGKAENLSLKAAVQWPALNTKELDELKQLFREKSIAHFPVEGKQASKPLFQKTINGFEGVLHLSTHGFYTAGPTDATALDAVFGGGINPLQRCGLVFAGANGSDAEAATNSSDNGILTGYEISDLDLTKLQLVTLSACETGLGEAGSYEGIFGLQRALKMAGAAKLLVSLWKVPAKETAALMKLFYAGWLKGLPPQEALRAAQKELRKKHAPYYWAGFVLLE